MVRRFRYRLAISLSSGDVSPGSDRLGLSERDERSRSQGLCYYLGNTFPLAYSPGRGKSLMKFQTMVNSELKTGEASYQIRFRRECKACDFTSLFYNTSTVLTCNNNCIADSNFLSQLFITLRSVKSFAILKFEKQMRGYFQIPKHSCRTGT